MTRPEKSDPSRRQIRTSSKFPRFHRESMAKCAKRKIWSDPGRNFKEKKIYDFSPAFGRKSNETKSLIEPGSKFGREESNFGRKSYKNERNEEYQILLSQTV